MLVGTTARVMNLENPYFPSETISIFKERQIFFVLVVCFLEEGPSSNRLTIIKSLPFFSKC